MDELDLEQSIEMLLAHVPIPVRDYVLNNLSGEVRTLMNKYQLHVDQGGVLQTELLLMLLGQEEPADFMKALTDAGISQEVVQSLMADINEDVFKPLRQKEQDAAMTPPPAPEPPKVEEPVARTMESDMRTAAPSPEAPPLYPQMPTGPQTQTYWVPVSITAVPQPYNMTQQPPPFPPPPPPAPEPPKVEEPVASPPAPTPPPAPEPRAWEPPPPPPNLPTIEKSDVPIKKEYGADPYREPV